MSDLVDFIEFVDYARRYREVGPRRYLRDYSDPFTKYSVQEFHARYRFTPASVKSIILPMLASSIRRPTKRGLPFAPEIMLLLTLRYRQFSEIGWRCHEHLPAVSFSNHCTSIYIDSKQNEGFC